MTMSKWPVSAWLIIVIIATAGTLCVHQTYVRTQASWYAAGINNGRNLQAVGTLRRLRDSNVLRLCPTDERKVSNEVLTVKTEAIYLAASGQETYLCE